MKLQRYEVIGVLRLGRGDEFWSSNPDVINALQKLGIIADKPAEVIDRKPTKKQEAK